MQTERQNVSLMGLFGLSFECQLGPLPGCQCSVQGCGFPRTDVTVPCESPCRLILLSSIDHSKPVPAQWPMPATAGTATTREGTGHGTGSFEEASVEKVLTSGPLRRAVMSNTLIIPSSF